MNTMNSMRTGTKLNQRKFFISTVSWSDILWRAEFILCCNVFCYSRCMWIKSSHTNAEIRGNFWPCQRMVWFPKLLTQFGYYLSLPYCPVLSMQCTGVPSLSCVLSQEKKSAGRIFKCNRATVPSFNLLTI